MSGGPWGGDRDDPHAQARAARDAPLLLHSLTTFREVIAEVFAHCRVGTVVEIGVESGSASAMYTDLGAHTVHCVEPAPSGELRADLARRPGLRLVEGPSSEVLADLPVADCYVVDGDHNYATVHDELSWIVEHAPDAVVLMHDLLWPCGRRDLYYQPSYVDAARRHPAVADGPSVWHDGMSPAGFVGLGAFTSAEHAGGERNGVLTAVEDCIAGTAWTLAVVPAVFGLGVLVRDDDDLLRRLVRWTGSDLLATMENNRLALYGRVLELQRTAAQAGTEIASLRARLAGCDAPGATSTVHDARRPWSVGIASRVHGALSARGRQVLGSRRIRGISRSVRRW